MKENTFSWTCFRFVDLHIKPYVTDPFETIPDLDQVSKTKLKDSTVPAPSHKSKETISCLKEENSTSKVN